MYCHRGAVYLGKSWQPVSFVVFKKSDTGRKRHLTSGSSEGVYFPHQMYDYALSVYHRVVDVPEGTR